MTDADDILAEASRLLARAVTDHRSAFRTPILASVDAQGSPQARVVVLRAWDAAERVLTFHTDARSAKAAQIAAQPDVALCFWDPGRKVQLRIAGAARLHRDDAWTLAAWRAATQGSRRTYRVARGPGCVVDDPASVDPLGLEEDAAYAHFTLVRVAAASLEWLHLAEAGHRRIRFTWNGAVRHEWLVP